MVLYERNNLKVAEVLFDEPERRDGADIIRYHFRTAPVQRGRVVEAYTLWIDLKQDGEAILGAMHSQTRYEIRRAAKDDTRYEFYVNPTAETAREFYDFFDQFAAIKGLAPANRLRLNAMLQHGVLDLSRMLLPCGETLVWHAHVRGSDRVRLMHSASLFRAMDKETAKIVSRNNRLMHWLDIQRFRDESFPTFDFGGWYAGKEDEAKLKINAFKESFGGAVAPQFNADCAGTWRGAAALSIRSTYRKLRGKED